MKKGIVFLVFASIVIVSCRKDGEINTTSYLGTWELIRSYSNGIVYNFTNYSGGNGNTVTFQSNGTFSTTVKTDSASFTNEYNYHLEKGKFCNADEPLDTFFYYGDEKPEVLRLQNGILSLESTMCVEGGISAGGSSYRKIN